MENGSSLGHLHVTCVIFPNNLLNYWRVYIDYFETAEAIDVRPAFFCVILYVVLCCGCWDLRAASKGSGCCVTFIDSLDVPSCVFWICLDHVGFVGRTEDVGSQSFKPLLEWPHWLTSSHRSEVCFWNSETQHRRAPEKEKWDCAIGFTRICVFFASIWNSKISKGLKL